MTAHNPPVPERWDCRERNGGECIFGGQAEHDCDECWNGAIFFAPAKGEG